MIYKRADSAVKWYRFKWTVKHLDGTKERFLIQRSAKTANTRKAEAVEEEHRSALRHGLIHPRDPWPKAKAPEEPSLRNFAPRFLAHAREHTKAGTAVFYSVATARLLNFAPLADARLTCINTELVSRYTKWHRSKEKSNSITTINGDLRTLRRILSVAEEWNLIGKRPKIRELPGADGRDRVVTYEEEAKYLGSASVTLRDLTVVAVDTGLRPNSELFPLVWSRVRFERTAQTPHGYIHVDCGKTKSAVRNIPLTPRVREVLLARKLTAGESQYVFPGEGNSGHITTVQHAHARTLRDTGISSFVFYSWRHTYGTRTAQSGMDKFSLARLMGHSSPLVTERYYIHVTDAHVSAGFERFVEYQTAELAKVAPASEQVQ